MLECCVRSACSSLRVPLSRVKNRPFRISRMLVCFHCLGHREAVIYINPWRKSAFKGPENSCQSVVYYDWWASETDAARPRETINSFVLQGSLISKFPCRLSSPHCMHRPVQDLTKTLLFVPSSLACSAQIVLHINSASCWFSSMFVLVQVHATIGTVCTMFLCSWGLLAAFQMCSFSV